MGIFQSNPCLFKRPCPPRPPTKYELLLCSRLLIRNPITFHSDPAFTLTAWLHPACPLLTTFIGAALKAINQVHNCAFVTFRSDLVLSWMAHPNWPTKYEIYMCTHSKMINHEHSVTLIRTNRKDPQALHTNVHRSSMPRHIQCRRFTKHKFSRRLSDLTHRARPIPQKYWPHSQHRRIYGRLAIKATVNNIATYAKLLLARHSQSSWVHRMSQCPSNFRCVLKLNACYSQMCISNQQPQWLQAK